MPLYRSASCKVRTAIIRYPAQQTSLAAACDICMSEATVAYRMSEPGAGLDEIRDEVDRTYGT